MKHVANLGNAEKIAQGTLAEVLQPPPPVDYLGWAERNIVFSKRESPFEGPYNQALFGFFDEIYRAVSPDDPCRTVTVMGSAQTGKTVVGNVFCGGSLEMDPGDFLYVHPTEDNAARWSKLKFMPFVRSTTALSRIMSQGVRDGANSILTKERKDGRGALLISGANSPASLSQVSMPRQVQDDLAKWENNSGGDPEAQADSRSRAYEFAKILKLSTPLIEPGCRITKSYNAGSQERFYLPCPHCAHMQTLEWENLLANLDEEHPEKACFTCDECGSVIEQHHLPEMRRQGEWRADNPAAKRVHRSFYIWSAYSPLQSWERIAHEWLKARGDAKAEQVFLNDTVGRAYKASGVAPPWETLRDRAAENSRKVEQVPQGIVVLTCGVDCQKDRTEWQVRGWGPDRKKAVIAYGVIPHHISTDDCRLQLDGVLKMGFTNAYGRKLVIDVLAIDGNAWTEDVWGWAKRHPASRVIMVRGVPSDSAALLVRVKKERGRTGKLLAYSKRFFNFATSILKWGAYRDLEKTDPLEKGYVDLPAGLPDSYFRQLTSETRREVKTRTGALAFQWVEDPNERNEALDTFNQAEAAFIRLAGPTRDLNDHVWAHYARERETPPEDQQLDLEDVLHVPQPRQSTKEAFPTGTQTAAAPQGRFRQRKMRTN